MAEEEPLSEEEPYSSDDIKRKKRKFDNSNEEIILNLEKIHVLEDEIIKLRELLPEENSKKKRKKQFTEDEIIKFRELLRDDIGKNLYDANFKIIIFGDARKTTLIQRFLTNLPVSDSKMTIGVDFEVKSLVIDEQKVKLQIWDFGDEERFQFLLPTFVRGARGGIYVYDVKNFSLTANIDKWLNVIRREMRDKDQFPIIAVGIIDDEKNERQISTEMGIKIAKSRNLNGFIECNIKTNENVEEVFESLTKLMLKKEGKLKTPSQRKKNGIRRIPKADVSHLQRG